MQKMQNVVHANACDAVKEELQEVSRGRTGTTHNFETGQRQSLNSLHSNFMADLTESDDDEASEAESFILDPEELEEEPVLDTSKFLLSSEGGGEDSPPEVGAVDPDTQARLEALLEATGLSKLSLEGKQLGDPEVLRRLTTSVSCALDEAAAALTRMRAEHAPPVSTTTTSVAAVPMPPQGTHQTSRTLAEACSDGDVRAVRQLLDEGRDVNEVTEEGESLLSLACASGYTELAQLLLAMRANVEDRGLKDTTPLMEAANAGHVAIVRLLIEHGADVNAQTAQGHTPLMFACSGGHEEVARALVAAGANVEDHNENGHTPLMEAASAGHVSTARVLVEAGASINTHSNEFKESALTLACYKGHLEMVRFLLEAGADQEHKTDEMHTALMEASMDGHVEVARLLLDSGAQVNMPTDSFESPLTLAACGGHVELAMLLLERGANIEEVNDEGYTPLMEAAREGHEEMVALLLSQGADINAQTEETQETALTLACCGGFLEVADFLLKAGANLELGASTPLMEAAQEGHVELLRYLVNAGASVNAKTATGDTALTYACENGHTDVADLLLQANADLEHESEGGRTPLMKAARAGHLCTVQFLLSRGADPNRPTANNDHTALSLACAGGHLAVVELLLAHGADPTRRLRDNSTMLIEAAKGGHTAVVQLLLDYPNLGPSAVAAAASVEASSRFGSHGLQVVPLTEEQRVAALAAAAASHPYFPQVSSAPAPATSVALSSRVGASSSTGNTDSTWTCGGSTGGGSKRKASDGGGPPMVVCSGAGSRLASGVEGGGAALRPSERLEACINSMMRSAELNHPSREEQILQKQQILEELQRVERELQEKAQAQIVLSAHHHHQHPPPPALPCEDVEELNLRNAALSSSPADAGCASLPPHSATCPAVVSTATTTIVTPVTPAVAKRHLDKAKSTKSSPSSILKETTSATSVVTTATASIVTSSPSTALHLHTQPPVLGLTGTTSVYPPTATTSLLPGANFVAPALDEGLMVAAPARTLHETLGDIVTGPSASSTGAQVSITAQQSVCPDHHHHHHHHHGTTHPALSQQQQQPPPPPLAFHPFPVHSQVDLNWQTESNHDTALTLACAGGHEELVSLLLTRGAHLEHRDKKGFTPLMLAATAGHAGVVDVLLAHGAEVEAQSERTKDTALSLACSGGRYEVVEILLERNANKEHRNVSDYTPLSLAASGGYVNIIKLLLQNGAEINSRTGSKLGISPLMLAAMNGHTAAVKLLLDNGSDINAQIETNKNTALTLACFQGRQEVVALLVDRKANVEHRAKTGLTPLMEAASGGYVEVGRVLLDKGADVNAPPVPSSRDTALTIAADKGHYAFVELLIKRGAQIDVKNKKGSSPLWLACNGGHLDVVQLLVAAQADIDSMDNRRVSCLMAAFRRGHVKAAKWLVKHVAQFPSDQEMARFMATLSGDSKDLLRKCHQCTEVIHAAKERQAAEANKCASILLEELDQERSREESRKAAAARRRERKRRRKKEKQEQIRLAKLVAEGGADDDAADKDNKEMNSKDSDKDSKNGGDKQASSQSEDEDEEEEEEVEEDLEEEDERLVHPGGAPASVHRNSNSNSVLSSNSTGKPKNSQLNGATSNKTRLKIMDDDSHNTSSHQYSNHNESSSSSSSPPKAEKTSSRNKKKQQPERTTSHEASTRTNNSSMLTASTAPSSKGKSSGEKTPQQSRNNPLAASSPTISTVVSSNHRQSGGKKGGEVLVNGLSSESEESSGGPKGSKHRLLYHSGNDLGKLNALDELVLEMNEAPSAGIRSPNLNRGLDRPSPNSNPSSSPKKQSSSLVNSLNNSLNSSLMSNKMHHRGEEGWKEVVRRSKKVTVPSTAISRVIGRCGCNINTIREVSGAHIEVEKHKGQGDRTILIRGSADATKQAQLLITGLVQEPERDLSEIMLQCGVGVKPSEPMPTATRGGTGSGTTAVSSNHVQSSVVVAGGAKPIRQPSSTKVMSVKAAAPAPSLPPFGQTRPAPRPGIPTGSSNVAPTPASTNPPFTPSSWSSPAPPGAKGTPTPISSQPAAPASMSSSSAASSVNTQPISSASTTYTQAVISPAKSTSRAASADARPLSSPTGSPSPAPPLPPVHSHSAASTPPSAAPPISIPQTFSPFNNVFSKETQPSVWGQREALKPNFASVAASGVCCSSASSSASSTGNPLPAPSPEPIIDAAKAPGYRGNLHVSPPNFGPIGSGPRSAPCTPPISAPPPASPPPQQQEYYDSPQSTQQQQAVASPASRLVFPGGRYCPEQSPIQSTLNPNAPDFSSRAAPTMMPPYVGPPPSAHDLRVQFPPQDYMPHHPSPQQHHVQHQQMAQQHQPHHASMFQLQMMSHLQQQYSGLVAQVAQHQVGKDDSSPSSVSPQGAMSPTTGGSLGPHQSGMLDDRKLPRPIGTERAQKKNVPVGIHHSSYPPPSAPGIWSYPNTAGNSGSSEMSQMAAWVQYQHAAGPQGDCLPPPLLHGRFGEGHSDTVLEHTYHQQLNSNLGTCPTFLNGFPSAAQTVAPQVLGGCAGTQLFPSSRDPPHPQEAPWSPHKLLQMDAMHHQHHQPPHPHSAAGKLPWQGWAHHQT